MPSKKFIPLLVVCVLFFLPFFVLVPKASSDQLDDINKQLADLTDQLNKSVAATQPLQSQLDSEQKQIASIKNQIVGVESDIALKKKQIDKGYVDLAQKEKIISATIRDFYIKSYYDSPLLTFFSQASMSEVTQTLAYQHAQTERDKSIITNIALTINELQTEKTALQQEEDWLAATKTKLDADTTKLNTVVTGAKAYQSQLSNQIATLSTQQQQLVAQKFSSLGIPLYAYSTSGGCSSDLNPYKDPGFGGTKFGFFTYGVPNRVGLNQYGALGRATAGQNSDTILHAYYNFDSYQTEDGNTTINVNDGNGYNTGNIIWSGKLDDYVKRIYEIPESWPVEALKAQAIAARSYVMAETNNGSKSICATQNCQVFKTDPKGGNWDGAVDQTTNQVMVQGGHPIIAWFSSTHGGYVYASGGDVGGAAWTKSGQDASGTINSWADLNNNAYDKASPWFYCDWGSRSSANGTAWMNSSDVADIANVVLLSQTDASTTPHLSQTDKDVPDTWNASQVQQELKNRGVTAYTNVSSISVSADFGSGTTTSVNINGDGGSHSFSGSNFKTLFNLRAPANIQIVGPLYNVETK
jgi:SpoIID/LytB domain protein